MRSISASRRQLRLGTWAPAPTSPIQALAAAVIRQAVADATGTAALQTRFEARAFLAGSPTLLDWCAVARLDPVYVIQRARLALQANRASPRHRRRTKARGRQPATVSSRHVAPAVTLTPHAA